MPTTMQRQFCCSCLASTDDYDTVRTTDVYGGDRVWHYCRTCRDTPAGAPIIGGLAIIAAAVQEHARIGRSLSSFSATPHRPPARVEVWERDGLVGMFLTDGHLFVSTVADVVS